MILLYTVLLTLLYGITCSEIFGVANCCHREGVPLDFPPQQTELCCVAVCTTHPVETSMETKPQRRCHLEWSLEYLHRHDGPLGVGDRGSIGCNQSVMQRRSHPSHHDSMRLREGSSHSSRWCRHQSVSGAFVMQRHPRGAWSEAPRPGMWTPGRCCLRVSRRSACDAGGNATAARRTIPPGTQNRNLQQWDRCTMSSQSMKITSPHEMSLWCLGKHPVTRQRR